MSHTLTPEMLPAFLPLAGLLVGYVLVGLRFHWTHNRKPVEQPVEVTDK